MFVFSNLAMSLDGKIAARDRKLFPLGTAEDWKQMEILRGRCEAILMGASTIRSFKKPCTSSFSTKRSIINAILTSRLERFSPTWDFFKSDHIQRVIFLTSRISESLAKKYNKYSQLIFLDKNTPRNPISRQMMKHLEKLGVKNLLIEGGGSLMWDFVQHNLIDEYHVTLTPRIIGGIESPTLVDGQGFSAADSLKLKLCQCAIRGDELFLTYRKR